MGRAGKHAKGSQVTEVSKSRQVMKQVMRTTLGFEQRGGVIKTLKMMSLRGLCTVNLGGGKRTKTAYHEGLYQLRKQNSHKQPKFLPRETGNENEKTE